MPMALSEDPCPAPLEKETSWAGCRLSGLLFSQFKAETVRASPFPLLAHLFSQYVHQPLSVHPVDLVFTTIIDFPYMRLASSEWSCRNIRPISADQIIILAGLFIHVEFKRIVVLHTS